MSDAPRPVAVLVRRVGTAMRLCVVMPEPVPVTAVRGLPWIQRGEPLVERQPAEAP